MTADSRAELAPTRPSPTGASDMPRWWSGGPSSPAAVTATASEDAAHMASISAAINQGTEQRHERQLKLRRLLTQVVIDAREEAGRCLSLVRTCVTERARFERAHKSPALAAADAELAAVREAEGKARANEVPYQSALALALQDGSSNALPEYNAALPSGGASGEYEQLQSRARAAAARADAWVTHLIDEHKGLRLSPRRVSAVPPQAQQNFQRYSQLLHVHFLVVGSSAERVCTSTYSVFMDLQRGHLRIPSCVSLPAYCL